MANSRFYSSVALQTTLTSGVNPSDTIIPVQATTGFPAVPFTLALDYGAMNEELIEVTSVSSLNLTATRAIDGTPASAHSTGAVVRHVSSARDFTDSRTHEASSSGVHGTTGAVVGTTNTQTLTNKTLTAATFNGVSTFTNSVAVNGSVASSDQLTVKGAASQSGNVQVWKDNSGTTLASIGASGLLTANDGATVTSPPGVVPVVATAPTGGATDILRLNNRTIDAVVVDTVGKVTANRGMFITGSGTAAADGTLVVRYKNGATPDTTIQAWQNDGGTLVASVDSVGSIGSSGNIVATGTLSAGAHAPDLNVPVASSGWTVTSSNAVISAKVISWSVLATRTGSALTATSTGSLPDTAVFTIPATWRPSADLLPSGSLTGYWIAASAAGGFVVTQAGLVSVTDAHPTSSISTSDTVRFNMTYVL